MEMPAGFDAEHDDNLSNMYQGCLEGVNNFDPWE